MDDTGVTSLRKELESLGLETRTPGLRGLERKLALELRLSEFKRKLLPINEVHTTSTNVSVHAEGEHLMLGSIDWESVTELRVALDTLSIDTRTPGLRGDERRQALAERLRSAIPKYNTPSETILGPGGKVEVVEVGRSAKSVPATAEPLMPVDGKVELIGVDGSAKIVSSAAKPLMRVVDKGEVVEVGRSAKSVRPTATPTTRVDKKVEGVEIDGPAKSVRPTVESATRHDHKVEAVEVGRPAKSVRPTVEPVKRVDGKAEAVEFGRSTTPARPTVVSATRDDHKVEAVEVGRPARSVHPTSKPEVGKDDESEEQSDTSSDEDSALMPTATLAKDEADGVPDARIESLSQSISEMKSVRRGHVTRRTTGALRDDSLKAISAQLAEVAQEDKRAATLSKARYVDSAVIHGISQRFIVSELRDGLALMTSRLEKEAKEIVRRIEVEESENIEYGVRAEMLLAVQRAKLLEEEEDRRSIVEANAKARKADGFSSRAVFVQMRGQDGLMEKAEELFEKAIRISPKHGPSLLRFANFHRDVTRRYDRADQLYRAAASAMPEDSIPLYQLAFMLHEKAKNSTLVDGVLRRCLTLKPDNADALALYGLHLQRGKQLLGAEKKFEAALSVDANHKAALTGLSDLRRKQGNLDAARDLLTRATTAHPEDVSLICSLANLVKESDKSQAKELFEKAVMLQPKNLTCLGSYASFAKTSLKDYGKSRELYLTALSIDPTQPSVLGGFAGLLRLLGQHDEAEATYRKAIERGKPSASVLGNFGNFLSIVRRQFAQANTVYLQAIKIDPRHQIVARNYAIFLRDHPEYKTKHSLSTKKGKKTRKPKKPSHTAWSSPHTPGGSLPSVTEESPRSESLAGELIDSEDDTGLGSDADESSDEGS